MDYVTVCGIFVLIVWFGIDIWKTFKDRKDSQKEHEDIKEIYINNSHNNTIQSEGR